MSTGTLDSGTETDLGRLASLKWRGTVIAVVGGAVLFWAILGGILWHLAVAQTERTVAQAQRASIMETLASIKKAVAENKEAILANGAALKAIRTTVEANSAGIKANGAALKANGAALKANGAALKAIRTTVEANSAGIKASSVGIAENRATIALVLKPMEENRKLLVLLRGDIASLKQIQEEFGRQQRLLLARHLEFSGKLEEFRDRIAALAETRARDAAEARSAAARMGDIEALVVDLDGRVKRLEDLILVSDDGAAAPYGGE